MSRFGTKAFWSNWRAGFFSAPGSVTKDSAPVPQLNGVPTNQIRHAAMRYLYELERRLHVENAS